MKGRFEHVYNVSLTHYSDHWAILSKDQLRHVHNHSKMEFNTGLKFSKLQYKKPIFYRIRDNSDNIKHNKL